MRRESGETYLVIEVSHHTTRFDSTEKRQLYANAGIGEYWQVDVTSQTVTVCRQPRSGQYGAIATIDTRGTVRPLCLPTAVLNVGKLFEAD